MKSVSIFIGELVDSGEIGIQTGPFGTQLRASDYTAEGTPVINVRNIGYGNIRPEKLEYVPDTIVERLSNHILDRDDIVFGRKGAVDRHILVGESQVGWMQGSDCIRIRVKTPKLIPEYLSRAFCLDTHKKWMITQCSNKATMASLNQDVICRIPIKIPDPHVQREIVSILSAYDNLIENNRRRIQLLEQAARLLYKEWFVHLRFPGHKHTKIIDGVPEGWEKKVLGDVCFEVRETVLPNSLEPNTPYIGLEHLPRRSITLCEWGQADQVTSSKHRFREGEILFGKIRPYFHKVGIALTDGVSSSDAIIIRPESRNLLALILMTTSSDGFVAVTAQQMKEGSKMPRADWKQMQQYPFPVPSDGLLRAFNDFIDPILTQLKALSFSNRRLSLARDLLLPKLMNGEVAV